MLVFLQTDTKSIYHSWSMVVIYYFMWIKCDITAAIRTIWDDIRNEIDIFVRIIKWSEKSIAFDICPFLLIPIFR